MTPVVLPATIFDPPLVASSPIGLYQHVVWPTQDIDGDNDGDNDTEPYRFFLTEGVAFRPHNYGGEDAFGVWGASWCTDPDSIDPSDYKQGDRPDVSDLTPFVPQTVYAFDHNYCGDLHAEARQEVRDRAQHNFDLLEQIAAETQFSARLLDDAGSPASVDSLDEAVGQLEAAMSKTGTTGLFHINPFYASVLHTSLLIGPDGKSPMGHTWVFGGGYVDGLENTIVATSQVFGWRGATQANEATYLPLNQFIAVVERTVLLGYEKLIAAVTLS